MLDEKGKEKLEALYHEVLKPWAEKIGNDPELKSRLTTHVANRRAEVDAQNVKRARILADKKEME